MRLDAVEARIIGSLVEKQLTTPQQYPLSLNSLTLACNQSSNRDPVVSFSEPDVEAALNSLKAKGMVRFVLPSHGRSVVRYRHVLDEKLALDQRQMALVAVLMLRGPQTVGELRARTERMARFESVDDVESDLEGLTRWEEPLVVRLARRPGQKEERWAQLLAEVTGMSPAAIPAPSAAEGADREPAPSGAAGTHSWSGGAYNWSEGDAAGASDVPGSTGDESGGTGGPAREVPAAAAQTGAGGAPSLDDLHREMAALKDQLASLTEGVAALHRDMAHIRAELGME